MDERTRSFRDLPRWVAARNDDRAGFIQLAADGLWRAYSWSGYRLEPSRPADEAEAAVRAGASEAEVQESAEAIAADRGAV